MQKTYGFGIIGCGNISDAHAQSILDIEQAELISVCDIIPEKAMKKAEKYQCSYDLSINQLLQRENIDIVCICTPSGLHHIHGILAAKAKKHVIVEKPIDITLNAAMQLIDTCKKEQVLLTGILQHRFDDDIIALKTAIQEGNFGTLNFGGSHTKWFRSQAYYDSGDWRGTWELDGGGALMNQSIHYIDLLQYLMGPVEELFAYCATRAHNNISVEDIGVASVQFKNGAVGMIEGNTAAYPGYCSRLDIYGSCGSAIIVNDKISEWNIKKDDETDIAFGKTSSYKPTENSGAIRGWASAPGIWHTSHKRQITDFINAISENRLPKVTGEEALKPLAIILSIYESAQNKKPVKVPVLY